MSNPPPLPSRLPPKTFHPKPSPGTPGSNSSKYSDTFGGSPAGDGPGTTSSPHAPPRRPPVAPRKPHAHRPSPELNNNTINTATSTPPPPLPPVTRNRGLSTIDGGSVSLEGFGHCLQQGYEAINKRHDDELLALESLRGHIFHRARADKEYAESLMKMNQKASKKLTNINQSSAVVQVQTVNSI